MWQGVREHRGRRWAPASAPWSADSSPPEANFGRTVAAYGGILVAGSLAWGIVLDGFRPDRFDLVGAAVCLVRVAVIMDAPR